MHDLFHDAPELLHEFNDFLPTGLSGVPGGGQTGLVNDDAAWTNPESLSAIADKPQPKKQAPKRKKRPVEKEASPGPAPAKAPPAKVRAPRLSKTCLLPCIGEQEAQTSPCARSRISYLLLRHSTISSSVPGPAFNVTAGLRHAKPAANHPPTRWTDAREQAYVL